MHKKDIFWWAALAGIIGAVLTCCGLLVATGAWVFPFTPRSRAQETPTRTESVALVPTDPDIGEIHLEASVGGLFTGAMRQEFHLHAGRIISSNADKVEGTTATWYDPYYIEAVVMLASSFSAMWVAIPVIALACVVAGAVVVGAIVFFVIRGQRAASAVYQVGSQMQCEI